MTSALSAALKKPTLDQAASSALADSLKAPPKAATASGFDLSSIPLPPSAFPGLYQSSAAEDDFVAELESLALGTSIGTQAIGSLKSRSGTPVVRNYLDHELDSAIGIFKQDLAFPTALPFLGLSFPCFLWLMRITGAWPFVALHLISGILSVPQSRQHLERFYRCLASGIGSARSVKLQ